MRTEPVHDRPVGLFILAGFVVLGVIVQITALPPRASASDARRVGEKISFAAVEPLPVPGKPAQDVPANEVPFETVEIQIGPVPRDTPPTLNPDTPVEPVDEARPALEVYQSESMDEAAPEVPEPEAEMPVGRQGFQVMGGRQSVPLAVNGDNIGAMQPDATTEAIPVNEEEPYQDDATVDEESLGAQLVVLGPAVARVDDEIRFVITAENIENIVHAPLRLSYDPAVLEFVVAEEGDLMRLDGAATVFMASEGNEPGQTSIALSRMPPAEGANGSGVLCTVTLRGIAPGYSPIVLGGSRLLDGETHDLDHVRNDSYVAIE